MQTSVEVMREVRRFLFQLTSHFCVGTRVIFSLFLQLRVMSNMMGQPRMGVMPMRIGMPMQVRPGFHPAMQQKECTSKYLSTNLKTQIFCKS